MIRGLFILALYQLVGDFLVSLFRIPIPGPVVGMLLLFASLCIRKTLSDELQEAAGGLLQYIGLIFVPAGAGISMYLGLIEREWKLMLFASATTTICTLLLTAMVYLVIHRLERS